MESSQVYADRAIALFLAGYNCCQAVFAACCERFGMPAADGLRLTAGMGGGMGGMREKCGAVTAMFLLAGLQEGSYEPEDITAKEKMYALVQKLDQAFVAQCGTTSCKELLIEADCAFSKIPALRTEAYYAARPCATLVGIATRIAMDQLAPGSEKGRRDR